MFIIHVNYIKPLSEVDKYIADHAKFLDKQYANNNLIVSGRKNPRTGGIILTSISEREELEHIVSLDPFFVNKIAEYEIIEFVPTKYDEGFKKFIKE